jgi:hypothetical protein
MLNFSLKDCKYELLFKHISVFVESNNYFKK